MSRCAWHVLGKDGRKDKAMNWQLLLPLLVTTCVAVLGWAIVHRLNTRRDQENKRREIRVKYLIDAYRSIEAATDRVGGTVGTEFGPPLESAIADILLFGSLDQIRKAKEVVHEIVETNKGITAPLLYLLRDDLRKELSLAASNEELLYFRLPPGGKAAEPTVKNKQ